MAVLNNNNNNTIIKTSSFSFFFFFSLLHILTHSLSSPLPRLPDVYYSPDFPFFDGTFSPSAGTVAGIPLGEWTLLHRSIGISAMHMQLLYNDKIIIFDRTDFGPSNLSLPASSKCIPQQNDVVLGGHSLDCTAHSLLYDVASNTFRPLTILTDTWCSSGSVDPTGKLIQTGGYSVGERVIRTFTPCSDHDDVSSCDWEELNTCLAARRWYASNHVLPDGRVIVVGGRGSHSYEFFPKPKPDKFYLRFLADTWDGRNKENNLYPFLFLLPNSHLFIFANNRSVEFDYVNGKVIKEFPIMPSGDKRNYPSTGSSVLLPIRLTGFDAADEFPDFEVLICGGASPESFDLANLEKVYVAASRTCGRMKINDPQPRWIMEEMPMPRVMPDMVMLPTGDILIVNGAANGTAGWENADNPVLNPVLYRPYEPNRFVVLNPTGIPRMYHSSAVLVPDGRVIVGGSNPHRNYNFTPEAKYPTELSLEGYSPPYLDPRYSPLRPSILAVETENKVVTYGQMLSVTYELGVYRAALGVAVTMVLPPFATHSFGMNQRLVVLGGGERVEQLSENAYKVTVRAPVNVNVGPPGYYMLFVVHAGVPSHGVWVQLKRTMS